MSESIKDIGGEFELIKRITRKIKDKNIKTQIGDDAAVLDINGKLVISSDMIVEDDHFSLEWSSPVQIGKKAMEVNVSDIASKGALPKYALVSICIPQEIDVKFMEELYKGLYEICDKYNFEIIGGDLTHGKQIVIDVTIIGVIEDEENLCLRSDAQINDLILTTGYLGRSACGLELLRKGIKGEDIKNNLEPKARLKKAQELAPFINAMIDVSDGLASEINHICEMSNTGAIILKDKIPIANPTIESSKELNKDPYTFALSGGEDFELIFTISKDNFDKHKDKLEDCFIIGEIINKEKGTILKHNDEKVDLIGGYDHFIEK